MAWEACHESIRMVPLKINIAKHPADARILSTLLNHEDIQLEKLLAEAMSTSGNSVPLEALDMQLRRLVAQASRVEPFTQEDLHMLVLADMWEAQEQEGTEISTTISLGNWRIKKTSDSNPTGDGQNIRDIERDRAAG